MDKRRLTARCAVGVGSVALGVVAWTGVASAAETSDRAIRMLPPAAALEAGSVTLPADVVGVVTPVPEMLDAADPVTTLSRSSGLDAASAEEAPPVAEVGLEAVAPVGTPPSAPAPIEAVMVAERLPSEAVALAPLPVATTPFSPGPPVSAAAAVLRSRADESPAQEVPSPQVPSSQVPSAAVPSSSGGASSGSRQTTSAGGLAAEVGGDAHHAATTAPLSRPVAPVLHNRANPTRGPPSKDIL